METLLECVQGYVKKKFQGCNIYATKQMLLVSLKSFSSYFFNQLPEQTKKKEVFQSQMIWNGHWNCPTVGVWLFCARLWWCLLKFTHAELSFCEIFRRLSVTWYTDRCGTCSRPIKWIQTIYLIEIMMIFDQFYYYHVDWQKYKNVY